MPIAPDGGVLKNIWVPLSAAISQQRNVDTIANNVANANTPGFKKDQLVFKEYLTTLDKGHYEIDQPHREWKPGDFYRSYGAENSYVQVDGSFTNFKQGQLTPTRNPFDIAVQGKGFFEILTPNGIRYSRKGSFSLSREGELVTDQGYKVLGKLNPKQLEEKVDPGKPPISPADRVIKFETSGRPTVNLQGEVYVRGQKIADLSVVEFKDPHALYKEGNSMYINKGNENISTRPNQSAIYQGFVEESNVNAVAEMSNLIKAHRHFESIQKAIKTYDTISGRGVNDIAKF